MNFFIFALLVKLLIVLMDSVQCDDTAKNCYPTSKAKIISALPEHSNYMYFENDIVITRFNNTNKQCTLNVPGKASDENKRPFIDCPRVYINNETEPTNETIHVLDEEVVKLNKFYPLSLQIDSPEDNGNLSLIYGSKNQEIRSLGSFKENQTFNYLIKEDEELPKNGYYQFHENSGNIKNIRILFGEAPPCKNISFRCNYRMQRNEVPTVICKFDDFNSASGLIDAYFMYFQAGNSTKLYKNKNLLPTSETELKWMILELQENYLFNLITFNELGINHREESIELKKISVPYPVHSLNYLKHNAINWTNFNGIVDPLSLSDSLVFEISLKSDYHRSPIELIFTSNASHQNATCFEMSLDGLGLIPYTEVVVKIKAKIVGNDDSMWSDSTTFKIKTIGQPPPRPPKTQDGGFSISKDRKSINIYWEQLQVMEYYGENLRYNVTVYNSNDTNIVVDSKVVDASITFATFETSKIDLSKHSYIFEIRSENDYGKSDSTTILIQNQKQSTVKPFDLKTLISNAMDYEFTWRMPEVTNMSIYEVYCVIQVFDSPDTPFVCSHSFQILNQTTVKKLKIKNNMPLAFGVMTQSSDGFSSGIVWSSCSVNQDMNKIGSPKSLWIHKIGTQNLELKWSLKCKDQALVHNYTFNFCQVKSQECKNYTSDAIDIEGNTKNFEGLKPFCEYQIKMMMNSLSNEGGWSSKIDVKTHITKATPVPEILNVTYKITENRTITSIVNLRLDETYDDVKIKYRVTASNGTDDIKIYAGSSSSYLSSFNLTNLKCFTKYTINAVSEMDYYSDRSLEYEHSTEICAPEITTLNQINKTRDDSNIMNSNSKTSKDELWIDGLVVTRSNGHLDYYEITIKSISFYGNEIVYKIPQIGCYLDLKEHSSSFHVYMRAVNIIDNADNLPNLMKYRQKKSDFQNKLIGIKCSEMNDHMKIILKDIPVKDLAKSIKLEVNFVPFGTPKILMYTFIFITILVGFSFFGVHAYKKLDLHADYSLLDEFLSQDDKVIIKS